MSTGTNRKAKRRDARAKRREQTAREKKYGVKGDLAMTFERATKTLNNARTRIKFLEGRVTLLERIGAALLMERLLRRADPCPTLEKVRALRALVDDWAKTGVLGNDFCPDEFPEALAKLEALYLADGLAPVAEAWQAAALLFPVAELDKAPKIQFRIADGGATIAVEFVPKGQRPQFVPGEGVDLPDEPAPADE